LAGTIARAGPVTGPLDRPSQQPPETRKAEKPKGIARRKVRIAMQAVHVAERHLLQSAQRYEIADATAIVAARGQQLRDAGMAAITGRIVHQVAALSPTLSKSARAAAIAKLRDEEVAEIAVFQVQLAADTRNESRTVVGALRLRHKQNRTALLQRHRRERIGAVMIGVCSGCQDGKRKRFAVDRRGMPTRRSRAGTVVRRRKRPKSQRRKHQTKAPKET
jgi:hypothetical protein